MWFPTTSGNGSIGFFADESEVFDELAHTLFGAYSKISEKTCEAELKKTFAQLFVDRRKRNLERLTAARLSELYIKLSDWEAHRPLVYIEVSGLHFEGASWKFGPARLLRGNHSDIESLRTSIATKDGQKPDPIPEGTTVIEITSEGDAGYAKRVGKQRAQEVIDALQFLSLPENRDSWDAGIQRFVIQLGAEEPFVRQNSWCYSPNGPTWYSDSGILKAPTAQFHRCVLSAQNKKLHQKRGGDELEQLLSALNPSALDISIKICISWIASAVRENDPVKKYLGFFIALEALFLPDIKSSRDTDNRLATILPIPDCVAFLTKKHAKDRRSTYDQVSQLTRIRNHIVHRGSSELAVRDVQRLGVIAWNCCVAALTKRAHFRTDGSFREYLVRLKFGQRPIVKTSKAMLS